MHFRFLPIPIFGRIQVYFSCKGKVISSHKIQLYAYNNISYKTVPITIFRLMGNNVNFVKWQWNHFVIGSRRIVDCRPMFTEILPRMHLDEPSVRGTTSSIWDPCATYRLQTSNSDFKKIYQTLPKVISWGLLSLSENTLKSHTSVLTGVRL